MGKARMTAQSEKFCKLIIEEKMGQTEAYMEAYPKSKEWKKGAAAVAASNLAKKEHIQNRLAELREKCDKELVKRYVWSKEKATNTLMRVLEKVEKNLDLIESTKTDMESKGNSSSTILSTVTFQTNSIARTVKEVAQELNNLYGLNKTNIDLTGQIKQVVFEGDTDLPDDEEEVDNEGNEIDEMD